MSRPTPRHTLLLLGALLPPLFLILLLARYAVPIPLYDQWGFALLLDKAWSGQLTFAELWAQHNEHRTLFPRLLLIGLARLTDWDIAYELGANVLAAALILMGLFRMTIRASRLLSLPWPGAALPALSLLVFSLRQHEGWCWGWTLHTFLTATAVVWGLDGLARARTWTTFHFGVGLLAGFVASFSFASGVLYWGAGLFLLWTRPRGRRLGPTLAFGLAAVACLVLFGSGYVFYSSASTLLLFAEPAAFARWALAMLAGPLGSFGAAAGTETLLGGLGCALLVLGTARAWRAGPETRAALGAFAALGLFAVGCGFAVALGRSGNTVATASGSRYVTLVNLLWCAIVCQEVLLAALPRARAGRVWSLTVVGLVLVVAAVQSVRCVQVFRDYHDHLTLVRENLFTLESEPLMLTISPDASLVRDGVAILKRRHLSVFSR